MAAPKPCKAGSFSKSNAVQCELCRAGTFAAADGSLSCGSCPPGSSCPEGASRPCICPINQYSREPGAAECSQCPGQAEPLMGQSECVSPAEPAGSDVLLYKSIVAIFGVIALGSVVLVVILVRSRHTFAVRPFHSGICIYIASFAPYALVKAVAVYRLLQADTQTKELTAGVDAERDVHDILLPGLRRQDGAHTAVDAPDIAAHRRRQPAVAGGERAADVEVHASHRAGGVRPVQRRLHRTCRRVCPGLRRVRCRCRLHVLHCFESERTLVPDDCQRQVDLTRGITYYEGVFAAVVAVVFTLYALLFNGLAYALLTSDATFSNLTRLQRMLISNKLLRCMMSPCERARCQRVRRAMSVTPRGRFIPPSWRPAPYQTTGSWSCGAARCVRSALSWR